MQSKERDVEAVSIKSKEYAGLKEAVRRRFARLSRTKPSVQE